MNTDKKLIIPLSDAEYNKEGTHWSLLIIDLETKTIQHFDSLKGPGNRSISSEFSKKISKSLGQMIYQEVECFKQSMESMDCGVHILVNAMRVMQGIDVKHPFSGLNVRNEILQFFENGEHKLFHSKLCRISIFFLLHFLELKSKSTVDAVNSKTSDHVIQFLYKP